MAIEPVPIGAIGAGRMGRGIALAFAAAGYPVTLFDLKPRQPDALVVLEANARAEIRSDLEFLTSVGALDAGAVEAAMARIGFAGREAAPATLASMALVFEGVPETLEAKRECFALLSAYVSADCIIASTTSTISPDLLAPLVTKPERFLNAHWLNPAHLMPLVELSPAEETATATIERTRAILKAVGKVPIVCKGAGYIVPRIQALAMNEAARMVEEGVASAEDIDTAVRVGFGLRFAVLGLLEFVDWGGCDILHHASAFLSEHVDAHRFAEAPIIARNMAEGKKGLRDGAGFYDYSDVDALEYRARRMRDFVAMLRQRGLMPNFIPGEH